MEPRDVLFWAKVKWPNEPTGQTRKCVNPACQSQPDCQKQEVSVVPEVGRAAALVYTHLLCANVTIYGHRCDRSHDLG